MRERRSVPGGDVVHNVGQPTQLHRLSAMSGNAARLSGCRLCRLHAAFPGDCGIAERAHLRAVYAWLRLSCC